MRRRDKAIAAGIACVTAAALLSGCATKATPENLLRDMEKRAEKAESCLMNMKMSMAMTQDSQEVGFAMDMDIESTADPEASHIKGTVSMKVLGMDFNVPIEMYAVTENEENVTYTLLEDQWTRETADSEETAGELEDIAGSMTEYADQFTLAEDLVNVNEQECFELSGELDGSVLGSLTELDMFDSLAEYGIEANELEGAVFPCTIDIYRDSILPARMYLDMADTMTSLVEGSGTDVSECSLELTFSEYDSIDGIHIPEEVKDQAVNVSDDSPELPDDDSGLYESDVKPAEPAEPAGDLGDNWDSYTVQVNQTIITLPCSVAALEAAGVKLDREYTPEDYVINPGEYELAWFEDDSGDTIMVDMMNTGDEPEELKDCKVSSIYADAYSMTAGSLKVIFPGGIQIGSTENELLKAYGEADDSYKDEEYGNSYFWYSDDGTSGNCNASITKDSGLIESISLDWAG